MQTYVITDFGVKKDCQDFQTQQIQAVLDRCREEGGRVIIPEGTFLIASLRMWPNTQLHLKRGARLLGSQECEDYQVYQPPQGLKLYTDQEAFRYLHPENPGGRAAYRRAMISAYGADNISITGEEGSLIDGRDCYDPEGEEGFRGPHGIFLSGCRNVKLSGYTIQNSGNFMHQLDNCENVDMTEVKAFAGHDGIHLHYCRNMRIKDCRFVTGDDCIAGADVHGLTVSDCQLNTSCNVFRIGGSDICIERCTAQGPGYYPHRMTVVTGRDSRFERTDGRHNTLYFMEFFASELFENAQPAHNIVVKDCTVTDVDAVIHYLHGERETYHSGMTLAQVTFANTVFTGLVKTSEIKGNPNAPMELILKNCKTVLKEGAHCPVFHAENATIIEE